jgi:hypothetical protein
MDNFARILFLVFGITIGAIVVVVLTRPKPTATYALAKTYQNEEKWEFLKDENGRVIGVTVHRKAEQNI